MGSSRSASRVVYMNLPMHNPPSFHHTIAGLFLAGIIAAVFFLSADGWPVISYRELRYEGVDQQENLYSCGPAALATVFSAFFGVEVSENEFAREIPENGVSMLDLKQASIKKGILAKGYEIPKGNLGTILRELSLPVLIHLDTPDDHFAVAVTQVGQRIVLADPSWGMRVISLVEICRSWDGLILAFAPNQGSVDRARMTILQIQEKIAEQTRTIQLSKMFLWILS